MESKTQNQKTQTYSIDASNKRLGRLASEAAVVLQGKKHPSYNPRLPGQDKVIIKNASKITISGKKTEQKIYYSHTTQIGHLKKRTYKQVFAKSPAKVIWKAIYNMLPKNRLRNDRMKRLKIEI